jgi:AcrR family transcriptional regulator
MTRSDGRTKRRAAPGDGPARRTELLAIAEQLFATRGYAQTTVRDIADEVGILSGSLYYYFESKEAMLEEILRDFMGGLRATFAEVVEGEQPPRAKLDEMVRRTFATIHRRRSAVALYQKEAGSLAGLQKFKFVEQIGNDNEEMWVGVIVAGQKTGDFRAELDPQLAYRFIRDAIWTSVQWYKPRGRLQHGAVADQYLTMLHAGLLVNDGTNSGPPSSSPPTE